MLNRRRLFKTIGINTPKELLRHSKVIKTRDRNYLIVIIIIVVVVGLVGLVSSYMLILVFSLGQRRGRRRREGSDFGKNRRIKLCFLNGHKKKWGGGGRINFSKSGKNSVVKENCFLHHLSFPFLLLPPFAYSPPPILPVGE